jgi:hypothetical protein
MNIFLLDWDVRKCAQYHVNRHSTKMCVEYAQLLYWSKEGFCCMEGKRSSLLVFINKIYFYSHPPKESIVSFLINL